MGSRRLGVRTNRESDMRIHMIGNAHIDPVWLWTFQEGRQEVLATFRSAVARLAEDADAIFVASSALHYAWVEESDPETFARIQDLVRQGRWSIVGGWWLQPDCNLPSGESFVRQALYGQAYFRSRFGVRVRVGYNVDSFGHAGTLPQLLARAGYHAYVFMRPKPEELELPSRLFRWRSSDGSEVVAYRLPFTYCTWGGALDDHVRAVAQELADDPAPAAMCFYGVGNHGGGPTRENLTSVHRLSGDRSLPELGFSTPERFFEQVAPAHTALPVWPDELQHHASGCYAAHAGVKRWNRHAEERLGAAERWSTVAATLGFAPYPRDDLEAAWKAVLFNQFHDIIAGSCIDRAFTDARDTYGEALSRAGRALDRATQAIACRVTTPNIDGSRPYVVFNAHAHPVDAFVEVEGAASDHPLQAIDADGTPLPTQHLVSEATAEGRVRHGFPLSLPPLGYRSVALVPFEGEPAEAGGSVRVDASQRRVHLANDHVQVVFDLDAGGLCSLRLDDGPELLAGAGLAADVVIDESDTWAHGVTRFDQVEGRFTPERLEVIEAGPVRVALRLTSRYGASTLSQRVSLRRGDPRIDVHVELDWHERHRICKLRLPLGITARYATYEQPYGEVERPTDGEEEPGQRWLDVSGTTASGEAAGLSLLNDGKYSFDVTGATIGVTIARSPIIAHHDPVVPEAGSRPDYLDQGVQRFRLQLLPHRGDRTSAGTARHAVTFNHGPIVLPGMIDGRTIACEAAYLWCDSDTVEVAALKRAEADEGTIVRLLERAGAGAHVTLHAPFLSRTVPVELGPHELVTLHLPDDAAAAARRVDLLESDGIDA